MPETHEQVLSRLKKETEEIQLAFASAALAWNGLENGLAMLIQELMQRRDGLPIKIYFAPNNTETRLRILDVTLRHRWDIPGIDSETLLKCAKRFMAKVQDAQESRNKIAHCQIVTVPVDGVSKKRLMPPILNLNKAPQTEKEARKWRGIGKSELNHLAERITQCAEWAIQMARFYGAAESLPPDALQEKFAELRKSLKVTDPQSGDQTPRGH
jgi:hypothetical protein